MVFRRPPPVVLDPSLSDVRHVPDTGDQPCANSFGLWQHRPGWPSCVLGPTTPVSAERGCTVDLSPAAIRPHLRRAGLPPLAACPCYIQNSSGINEHMSLVAPVWSDLPPLQAPASRKAQKCILD